jgi:hypothetical protein
MAPRGPCKLLEHVIISSILSLTWKVALHRCGVEVVGLFKAFAIHVVECVEVNSAVCGCEGKEGKKGVEELHCSCWC